MAQPSSVITLEYTPTLTHLADRFAHLSGFAYLDSGEQEGSAEIELLTALPSLTHRLDGYSGNLAEWMTGIERDLAANSAGHDKIDASGTFTGCIAVGCLDYDAPAGALMRKSHEASRTAAGIYHWMLISHREHQTTELLIHPNCPETTRLTVLEALAGDTNVHPAPYSLSAPFTASISQDDYREAIKAIQNYILAGDCYQVNFAQRFQARLEGDPWSAYRATRSRLAGGFSGFMRPTPDHAILSLSPERFLKIQDGLVTTQPIKGTAPRHADAEQDKGLADALLTSEKDRAENIMITDLLRNDLGQFCEIGSVRVTELCGLHSFGNVHHLVSTVEGQLAPGVTGGQMLLASSPGGSITGAPKRRAVEIIAELESHARGAYCGSLFVMANVDWLQSSIAIRTLEVRHKALHCWGGGGITASSSWESEHQETLDKVGPIMETLASKGQCSGSSMPS